MLRRVEWCVFPAKGACLGRGIIAFMFVVGFGWSDWVGLFLRARTLSRLADEWRVLAEEVSLLA